MSLITDDGSDSKNGANSKPKPKKSQKDKNLTVKPIRIQLENRTKGLKQRLSDLKLSEVTPLETQIAGHGSGEDGHCGMLQHHLGFVLKPVQPPPRGQREVDFYQKISVSIHPDDIMFREMTPKFYGVESMKVNGHFNQFLVFENVNFGYSKPCVMDVKIGQVTYGHDASKSKIERESKSYPGTKGPLGISVLGIISHSDHGYNRLTKEFGRSLTSSNLDSVLDNFIGCNEKYAKQLAKCFLLKLREIEAFMLQQRQYHVFASSILFSYDYERLDQVDWSTPGHIVSVKMIDFAHIFASDGSQDDNYLFGLRSLIRLFETFVGK